MSHEGKPVTPVTADSQSGHHFGRRPHYRALLCSGVCDLDCKLERTGHSRLKERVSSRRAWSLGAIKARKHKHLRNLT